MFQLSVVLANTPTSLCKQLRGLGLIFVTYGMFNMTLAASFVLGAWPCVRRQPGEVSSATVRLMPCKTAA